MAASWRLQRCPSGVGNGRLERRVRSEVGEQRCGEGVATIEAIARDLLLGALIGDLLPDPFDGFDPFAFAISGL
jgi:hypothetical protein